ncbi:Alpha-D-phosphohexomutase alpha/beta/alpha I/II/III protein [Dioscorea alata]|uniref:Alpha-D-phosphohexomutase alpha/beta/alpha I/II/III protein n=1 Tax=Dioscorea alata TaxID=55571 RepID=A0ACB7UJ18_DIOAL|nr:Alpha-D-phosphohexomutase alpha/beta/alpha I/II/III protein [Dioscorea alata]
MEYDPIDSSGTDDDLPPSHQNRLARGVRVSGNGRAVGAVAYPRVQNDMETQIHRLEQEAYSSVLRAFKAQSDAITWEKESLITELRKELRVSDEEHRELLTRVNADDIIRRIRIWRQSGGGLQSGLLNNAQPVHESIPSPTVSASRKRQKTSQSIPSLSMGAPSPALHSQPPVASMQPSSSAAKKSAAAKSKKAKSGQALPNVPLMKSAQYPSTGSSGRVQAANKNAPSALGAVEAAEGRTLERSLIGQKVKTRWPEDNNFYEAVITDYNPIEDVHALVYDINTSHETWEWVNLKEISAEDIQWEGEDPGICRVGRNGGGRGNKKPTGRTGPIPGVGRGRGTVKTQSKKVLPPSQNGIVDKGSDEIVLLKTDVLLNQVERVFNSAHPDPLAMEKAKQSLKDHEQSLMEAIARLGDVTDGESEEGEHQFSQGQDMGDRGWRNPRQYPGNQHGANYRANMVGGPGREGSEGDQMIDDDL